MLTIYLCDVREADDEGDETDDEDEDLLPLPQHHGIFIHQSGDEAFHCAELTQSSIKRRESEFWKSSKHIFLCPNLAPTVPMMQYNHWQEVGYVGALSGRKSDIWVRYLTGSRIFGCVIWQEVGCLGALSDRKSVFGCVIWQEVGYLGALSCKKLDIGCVIGQEVGYLGVT